MEPFVHGEVVAKVNALQSFLILNLVMRAEPTSAGSVSLLPFVQAVNAS